MKIIKENHLKGFTMVEVIVAMIISATLAGFALSILEDLINTGNSMSRESSETDEIIFISSLVNETAFNMAEIRSEDDLRISFIDGEEKTLLTFSQSMLVFMKANEYDSISVGWKDLEIRKVPNSDLINEISFTLTSGSLGYPVHIRKEYPSAMLFNLLNETK